MGCLFGSLYASTILWRSSAVQPSRQAISEITAPRENVHTLFRLPREGPATVTMPLRISRIAGTRCVREFVTERAGKSLNIGNFTDGTATREAQNRVTTLVG